MIQPGLERIGALLKNVHFPWKAIHVAGTNGKGSICASTSALLTRRNIKNGRFTSPHIIDRWDCITVNDKPVGELRFKTVERHFIQLSERENINASPFEILTASAFQIFNDSNIDVGVVEVGMGGKLDATNILNNQVVSVISKIAHDHQSFLGHTLQEIAKHKAGILRPSIPYILNPRNDISVRLAVDDVAKEVGAGPLIDLGSEQLRTSLYSTPDWVKAVSGMSTIQRDNLALAYSAFFTALTSMKESTSKAPKLLIGVTRKGLPGRYQMQKFTRMLGAFREILVDGAHNRDAAKALDDYVSKKLRQRDNIIDGDAPRMVPVTWVIAMSEGKQVIPFLQALLRPGDMIVTTTFGPVDGMPWVKPMKPNSILKAAKNIIPDILGLCNNTPEVYRAVATAKYLTEGRNPIVVTGSLYLVGDLLRDTALLNEDEEAINYQTFDKQERARVGRYFTSVLSDLKAEFGEDNSKQERGEKEDGGTDMSVAKSDEEWRLQREIDEMNKELKEIEEEEALLKQSTLHPTIATESADQTQAPPSSQYTFPSSSRFQIRRTSPDPSSFSNATKSGPYTMKNKYERAILGGLTRTAEPRMAMERNVTSESKPQVFKTLKHAHGK